MGSTWYSSAQIICHNPKKVKAILEDIIEMEEKANNVFGPTSINDLKIKENSVFFHSDSYGSYGTFAVFESLFEILLEEDTGPIFCFEYVTPCQSQDFYFISFCGKIDEDEITDIFTIGSNESLGYKILCLDFNKIELRKEDFPNLYTICQAEELTEKIDCYNMYDLISSVEDEKFYFRALVEFETALTEKIGKFVYTSLADELEEEYFTNVPEDFPKEFKTMKEVFMRKYRFRLTDL